MSLLDEAMDTCVILDKKTVADGYGGYTQAYVEGVEIKAAIVVNNSVESLIAQKQGVTAIYTITTNKNLNLQYHDVIKRLRDGKIFRVKSDGDDKATPKSANLNMRQVTAEEWTLPDEGGTT